MTKMPTGPSNPGMNDDEADFDYDAIYYGEEDDTGDRNDPPEDPQELAEEYDHAYATYLDARQRFPS